MREECGKLRHARAIAPRLLIDRHRRDRQSPRKEAAFEKPAIFQFFCHLSVEPEPMPSSQPKAGTKQTKEC
jgi:hypothetical protein